MPRPSELTPDEQVVLDALRTAKTAQYWEGYHSALVAVGNAMTWSQQQENPRKSMCKRELTEWIIRMFRRAELRIPAGQFGQHYRPSWEFYDDLHRRVTGKSAIQEGDDGR